ncbi:MAG: efflux RND transporter periplasmic adaptor subunit [Desulfobacterales bacterium]|nr:efflux RND transporter periplasmic adaptor subunit [Desulfobacterales bacterium]
MENKKKITFIIFIILTMAVISYKFYSHQKIAPDMIRIEAQNQAQPKAVGKASIQNITQWYEAVGTVRPQTEVSIQAQVSARLLDIKVTPGDRVAENQILASLDDRQFLSRLNQTKQALETAIAAKEQMQQAQIAAQAALKEAELSLKRTKVYFQSQAATLKDLERAESVYQQAEAGAERTRKTVKGAEAGIKQAEEIVKDAEIALGYTSVGSPAAGKVLRRLVEPGDLAMPGKPLFVLQTADRLRFEAHVREGLINQLKIGQTLPVVIQALNQTTDTTIEEIIPYADSQTRTFLVKALLPPIAGLYPGMYGKLKIPVGQLQVVLIPRQAVRRVGQLELVTVKEKDSWKIRYIKTGQKFKDEVEVLSGLDGNELIALGR